jgi:hypothetical protein
MIGKNCFLKKHKHFKLKSFLVGSFDLFCEIKNRKFKTYGDFLEFLISMYTEKKNYIEN